MPKERHEIATSWDSGGQARVGSSPKTRRLSATLENQCVFAPALREALPEFGRKTRRVDVDDFSTERVHSPCVFASATREALP